MESAYTFYAVLHEGRVYFRSSLNRNFAALVRAGTGSWGFSSDASKGPPVTKISRKAMEALLAAKANRVSRAIAKILADNPNATNFRGFGSSPTDSWIDVADLPEITAKEIAS